MQKNDVKIAGFAIAVALLAIAAGSTFGPANAQTKTAAVKSAVFDGATLPDTKEFEALQQSCQICHSFDLVYTQRLSEATWKAEVAKMIRFGAPLPPASQAAVVAYLAKYLAPTAPRSGVRKQEPAPPVTLMKSP